MASRIRSPTSRLIRSTSSRSRGTGPGHVVGAVRVEQLEVATEHRERGAELVAGIVEEPALGLDAFLEPVEHVVEGPGQRQDIVVALLRDAP